MRRIHNLLPFDYSRRTLGSGYPKCFRQELAKLLYLIVLSDDKCEIDNVSWGKMFSRLIGGRWRPSYSGFDDVLLEWTAWKALTVNAAMPASQKQVQLVRGRYSRELSTLGKDKIRTADPKLIGEMVLNIWNERVTAVMAKYDHLRTVVLMKSDDLLEMAAFETDTVRYDPARFTWTWNKNKNLVGHDKETGLKRFTWQPSGSQFTITEEVPKDRIALRMKQPPPLDRDKILDTIQFNESWVEILP